MRRRGEGSRQGEEAQAAGRRGTLDLRRPARRHGVRLGGWAIAACALAWQGTHLRFNLSPCVPRGVYYLTSGEAPRAGPLVLPCPPAPPAGPAPRPPHLPAGPCPR